MIALVILVPVLFWVLAGVFANEKARKIGIQKSPVIAAFQGGIWVRQVLSMPEPQSKAPLMLQPGENEVSNQSINQNKPMPNQSEDDDLIPLDPNAELEPFDALPKRPKIGAVKTVCPNCRKKTKHDRDGKCLKCKELNTYLRRRWEIANDDEEIHIGQTDTYQKQLQKLEEEKQQANHLEELRQAKEEEKQQAADELQKQQEQAEQEQLQHMRETVEQQEHNDDYPHCPHCERRLFLDYYSQCVFCNQTVEVENNA